MSTRRKRSAAQVPVETVDITVDALGAQGDGIAQAAILAHTHTLYIPGALPGEKVRVRTVARRGDGFAAELLDILEPSPERAQPPCPHYAHCGGCALQHLNRAGYADWKRERVVRALAQRGFADAPVHDPVLIGEGTRRRVAFTAVRRGGNVAFGFNARASHDVVAIDNCPLLAADLNALIGPLSALAGDTLSDGQRARIHVTACENGADVLIEAGTSPELSIREALAAFVRDTHTVRLAWQEEGLSPEPIAQEAAPLVYLSGVPVELPSGAFLQASVEGEHAIRDGVLDAVGADATRVADLFCGLGSFTLPLAQRAVVEAVDSVEAPLRALERAAGRADLGGRVSVQVRDLTRQPLETGELNKFDAVVFDPPRAGAAEQAQYLAYADVPSVVGVSCNPATFARDARILADVKYELVSVQPIDQFTYSSHVELVAHFVRR